MVKSVVKKIFQGRRPLTSIYLSCFISDGTSTLAMTVGSGLLPLVNSIVALQGPYLLSPDHTHFVSPYRCEAGYATDKWPSVYDLNVNVARGEKRLDNLDLERQIMRLCVVGKPFLALIFILGWEVWHHPLEV